MYTSGDKIQSTSKVPKGYGHCETCGRSGRIAGHLHKDTQESGISTNDMDEETRRNSLFYTRDSNQEPYRLGCWAFGHVHHRSPKTIRH